MHSIESRILGGAGGGVLTLLTHGVTEAEAEAEGGKQAEAEAKGEVKAGNKIVSIPAGPRG